MSTPNDMLTFLAVAETGSFTKAAEILMTPKSNVSRKITNLEDQLDVRLLERTTRRLNLTEAGRVYVQHCMRVKEEIDGAKLSLEALTSTPAGTLRICTTVGVGQFLLAQKLIEFQQAFCKVNLDIQLTNRRVDLIEEGIDVAFRIGQSQDSTLISRRLCTIQMHLYAAPKYLEEFGEPNDDTTMIGHKALYMSQQGGQPHWPKYEDAPLPINPNMKCNDFNILYQAAKAGNGIALLPDYMCGEDVAQNTMVQVSPGEFGREVDIFAIYPSRKGKLPKLEALLQFLNQKLNP